MTKKICFVCHANYCRSPVAENIFKSLNKNVEVTSAGIFPFKMGGMDVRSIKFLSNKNYYSDNSHIASKLTQKKIDKNDIIFAFDYEILFYINKKFKRYNNKVKILVDSANEVVADPYKYNDDMYYEQMEKIEKIIIRLAKLY